MTIQSGRQSDPRHRYCPKQRGSYPSRGSNDAFVGLAGAGRWCFGDQDRKACLCHQQPWCIPDRENRGGLRDQATGGQAVDANRAGRDRPYAFELESTQRREWRAMQVHPRLISLVGLAFLSGCQTPSSGFPRLGGIEPKEVTEQCTDYQRCRIQGKAKVIATAGSHPSAEFTQSDGRCVSLLVSRRQATQLQSMSSKPVTIDGIMLVRLPRADDDTTLETGYFDRWLPEWVCVGTNRLIYVQRISG